MLRNVRNEEKSFFQYCEKNLKKRFLLHFEVDWQLYRDTENVSIIIDSTLCAFDIVYHTNHRIITVAQFFDGHFSNFTSQNTKNQNRVLKKILSFSPDYILLCRNTPSGVYAYIKDERLYLFSGKDMRGYIINDYLQINKEYLDFVDWMRTTVKDYHKR